MRIRAQLCVRDCKKIIGIFTNISFGIGVSFRNVSIGVQFCIGGFTTISFISRPNVSASVYRNCRSASITYFCICNRFVSIGCSLSYNNLHWLHPLRLLWQISMGRCTTCPLWPQSSPSHHKTGTNPKNKVVHYLAPLKAIVMVYKTKII